MPKRIEENVTLKHHFIVIVMSIAIFLSSAFEHFFLQYISPATKYSDSLIYIEFLELHRFQFKGGLIVYSSASVAYKPL